MNVKKSSKFVRALIPFLSIPIGRSRFRERINEVQPPFCFFAAVRRLAFRRPSQQDIFLEFCTNRAQHRGVRRVRRHESVIRKRISRRILIVATQKLLFQRELRSYKKSRGNERNVPHMTERTNRVTVLS